MMEADTKPTTTATPAPENHTHHDYNTTLTEFCNELETEPTIRGEPLIEHTTELTITSPTDYQRGTYTYTGMHGVLAEFTGEHGATIHLSPRKLYRLETNKKVTVTTNDDTVGMYSPDIDPLHNTDPEDMATTVNNRDDLTAEEFTF